MNQIRDRVFETNSSSSHSVTVSEEEIFDRSFDKEVLREGVLVLRKPRYEFDDWMRFYKPENILNFLIVGEVEARQYADWQNAGSEFPSDRTADIDVIPILCEHYENVRAAVEFIREECGIEVRMMMEPGDPGHFETGDLGHIDGYLGNRDLLRRALFSSGSFVETIPENSFPADRVPTDVGTVVETGYEGLTARW